MKLPEKHELLNQNFDREREILKGVEHTYDFFFEFPGENHYMLFKWISDNLDKGDIIADLGAYRGMSGLALSSNPDVTVISYDIEDQRVDQVKDIPNIDFRLKDCNEDIGEIIKAKIISLDIDPHDGIQEDRFIKLLQEANYKGIVIADDIRAMHIGIGPWWVNLDMPKEDITHLGHGTGTGLIYFE
jgi:hypothetical protein